MKSKIIPILLGILALASLIIYINFRQYAFPEHAITFQINQKQAEENATLLANQYLTGINEYKKATIFEIDETAKNYLEREIGPKQTGELAKQDVNLWYFTTRFFKQLQKEEIYISYAPDGRLVYFNHSIEETFAGKRVSKQEAQAITENFLSRSCQLCQRTNFPAEWNLVQYSKIDRPNRDDHLFVYERKNYALKNARQRVSVTVAGDSIIGFDEYLKVPQDWKSQFNSEKSYNNIAQLVAEVLSTLFITVPLIFIFFKKLREKRLSLKTTYIIGVIISAVTILETINNFSQYYFNIPTTQSTYVTLIMVIFGLIITWIFTYITTQATIATADSQYRESFPLKKDTMTSLRTLFVTPVTLKGIWIGACVGIIFFLYELAYYFLGRSIGFWVPADVNYSDAFNSAAPWIYPLTIGLLPAVSEEVMYRLFALSLFNNILGKKIKNARLAIILAAVLSSAFWAFQHSAYPQMPFFVRGVELTIIGLVFSWLFLRYGIVSSIAAHYSFNALQMAIFFLESKSWSTSLTAGFVALLPFIFVLIGILTQKLSGKNLKESQLETNADHEKSLSIVIQKEVEKIEPIPVILPTSPPVSRNTKISLIITCIACFVLVAVQPSPRTTTESQDHVANRKQIVESAKQFLQQEQIDYSSYISVATIEAMGGDDQARNYLQTQSDHTSAQYFLNKNQEPENVWQVRFFKPQQQEEYRVLLYPDGQVYTFQHILEEKASGDHLSEQDAEERAVKYLQSKITDSASFSLINTENLKRDNRNDYRFTFEDKEKVAEASRRVAIEVVDGKPQNLQNYIKIPESFKRKTEQVSVKNLIYAIGGSILGLLSLILLTNVLFKLYKQGKLKSKAGTSIATVVVIAGIISQINFLSIFFSSYDTDLSMWVFIVLQGVGFPITVVITFLVVKLVVNAGIALYQKYIGQILPSEFDEQKRLLGNALFLVFILSTIGVCILYSSQNLAHWMYPTDNSFTSESGALLDGDMQSYIPAIEGIKIPGRAITAFFVIIIGLCTARIYCRSWQNVTALIAAIALIIFFISEWKTQDLFAGLITFVPVILFTVLVWKYIVKNNIFFYILTLFYALVAFQALTYLSQEDTFFKLNGGAYVIYAFIPILLWLCYIPITKLVFKTRTEINARDMESASESQSSQ